MHKFARAKYKTPIILRPPFFTKTICRQALIYILMKRPVILKHLQPNKSLNTL